MRLTHQLPPPLPAADTLPAVDREEFYADRIAVGRQLGQLLLPNRDSQTLVLALPPGGVVVASEVARMLRLPLEAFLVRTFTIRSYPQLAAGALSENGGLCLNRAVLRLPAVSLQDIWQEIRQTMYEVAAQVKRYRHGRPLPPLQRRTVILVDDGLGDGLAQLAALAALHHLHMAHAIVATPQANPAALEQVSRRADRVVALQSNQATLGSIMTWQHTIDDETAAAILAQERSHTSASA
jgi:putative phosphoribosyl transferase